MRLDKLYSIGTMLSSDILEEQFGPTQVDVLLQDDQTRIIRTRVVATGQILEASRVTFDSKGVKAYPKIHKTVVAGQSMGKAFRDTGIAFVRKTESVASQKVPAVFAEQFKNTQPATVVAVTILVGPKKTQYAQILEVYAPEVKWPEPAKTDPKNLEQFAQLLEGHTVYLALGSNVGDSKKYLAQAVTLLQKSVTNIVSAPLYTSQAVGYTDQAPFLNTVIKGNTQLTPHQLLKFVKKVEKDVGRIERFRWGPREVDIDIIFYDDTMLDEPGLQIPHPRFAERDFVLTPLCDLQPELIDPISKQTVQELYKRLPKSALSIY